MIDGLLLRLVGWGKAFADEHYLVSRGSASVRSDPNLAFRASCLLSKTTV